MKWTFLFATLLALSLLSNSQTSDVPTRANQDALCGPSVSERIRKYFDGEEIRPTQIVNNTGDLGRWKSKTSTIKIGDHTIEWIDKVGKLTEESSVKIDGELITLKDKKGVNNADEDRPISFDSVGQWDQIKLYKLYDLDVIGITMGPRSCTGLMCGVSAQLMYDVKTKQKTYFGTFRTDDETRLFRFTNENDYYYIAKNFDGDPHGDTAPQVITYELYKREPSGKFVVQKNATGEKYYIKHTILTDMEFDGDKVIPNKDLLPDKLELNWIKKIN